MNIIYSRRAKKSIEKLETFKKTKIREGINNLPNGDIKKLKKYKNLYRLRISDLRVLFTMNEETIEIEDVLPRDIVYKVY